MWTAQCGRRRAGGYSSDIDWRSALTCSKSATDSRCAVASESTGSHGGLPYLSTGRRITEWSGVECALRYLHCTARCSWRKSACGGTTHVHEPMLAGDCDTQHARCAQIYRKTRPCALLTDGASVCGKFGLERAFRRQQRRALGSQKLSLQDFTKHSERRCRAHCSK